VTVDPQTTRVGWIGTGVMGLSMCGHVLDAGYAVTVHNRTRRRAEPLLEKGAAWADTPAEVAASSDVVCSIVGYPADVRSVILGPEGALDSASPGTVLVDLTTSEPSLAVEIHRRAAENGVAAIDAPVSGGDVGARNGTLSIMVGGDEGAVERVRPLLEVMGKTIVRQGGAGAGQHTKLVNQILIASGMIGVCEALLYGLKAGLDLERVLESVAPGAAGSWSLTNYAPASWSSTSSRTWASHSPRRGA
jgi:3-hydroxyisobutyrate dehydrogenase